MTKQEALKPKRKIAPHAAIALGALTGPALAVAYLAGVSSNTGELRQQAVYAEVDGKQRQADKLEHKAEENEAYHESVSSTYVTGGLAAGAALLVGGEVALYAATSRRRQEHTEPVFTPVDPSSLTIEQRFFPEYVAGNQERTLQAV